MHSRMLGAGGGGAAGAAAAAVAVAISQAAGGGIRPGGGIRWRGNTHLDNTVYCQYGGYRILEEDSVRVDGDNYLEGCDGIAYDDFNHEWILSDDSVYCDGTCKTAHNGDTMELYDGSFEHKDHVTELVDGRWAYENDDNIVELHDGSYAHNDDAVLLYDGTYAHNGEELVTLPNGDMALRTDCTEVFIPNEMVDDITNNLSN